MPTIELNLSAVCSGCKSLNENLNLHRLPLFLWTNRISNRISPDLNLVNSLNVQGNTAIGSMHIPIAFVLGHWGVDLANEGIGAYHANERCYGK